MEYLSINGLGSGSTAVSNTFIDHYMITAGSTHLKTYLMLLRMISQNPESITVALMADRLDCGESDVIRSLKHWEKKGLMSLAFAEDGSTLTGLTMYDPERVWKDASHLSKKYEKTDGTAENDALKAEAPAANADPDHQSAVRENSLPEKNVDLNTVSEDASFKQLVFVAETYLGRPLTHSDCETFAWLYDKLKMNSDLLEYLVEYCVSNNHTNVRYMEAVAIDWHQKKIETVDQAKIYTPLNGQKIYAIMKALGLGNRQPGQAERQVIDGWFTKYGFSVDMIVEACNRTMLTIHKPQLSYVESILNRWKEEGIDKLEQVKALDGNQSKSARSSGKKTTDARNGSEGHRSGKKAGAAMQDFEQRSNNYDALMKQLADSGND